MNSDGPTRDKLSDVYLPIARGSWTRKLKTGVVAGLSAGGVAGLLLLIFLIFVARQLNRRPRFMAKDQAPSANPQGASPFLPSEECAINQPTETVGTSVSTRTDLSSGKQSRYGDKIPASNPCCGLAHVSTACKRHCTTQACLKQVLLNMSRRLLLFRNGAAVAAAESASGNAFCRRS